MSREDSERIEFMRRYAVDTQRMGNARVIRERAEELGVGIKYVNSDFIRKIESVVVGSRVFGHGRDYGRVIRVTIRNRDRVTIHVNRSSNYFEPIQIIGGYLVSDASTWIVDLGGRLDVDSGCLTCEYSCIMEKRCEFYKESESLKVLIGRSDGDEEGGIE